jgi:hypothetical protein
VSALYSQCKAITYAQELRAPEDRFVQRERAARGASGADVWEQEGGVGTGDVLDAEDVGFVREED